MNTRLLYLTDMCTLCCDARVIKIETSNPETATVIVDQTLFYPQGGGQPSDKGTIWNDTAMFTVNSVFLTDGIVHHTGTFNGTQFNEGDTVTLQIDPELRTLHSRNHTAGHVIDYAMFNLGYKLPQAKAYHFPQGPYVEYQGTLEQEERETLVKTLEQEANRLVVQAIPVTILFIDNDPLKRAMVAQGYQPILCGGTHVTNTQDVGHITIRKIKNEKGNLRVSYAV